MLKHNVFRATRVYSGLDSVTFRVAVPPGNGAMVQSVAGVYTADATVASRVPLLTFRDRDGNHRAANEPNEAIVANTGRVVGFHFGAPWSLGTLSYAIGNELQRLIWDDDIDLLLTFVNGAAGDQFAGFEVRTISGPMDELLSMIR